MLRIGKVFVATLSVFAGSLLSDIVFGDGIQTDDINQAVMVAAIAGIVQLCLTLKKSRKEPE
jgi:hypothetical protein